MKKVFENLICFVSEQKKQYVQLIEPNTNQPWDSDYWGKQNSGWLAKRGGAITLQHLEISRMRGFENQPITTSEYVEFMKAIVVKIYIEKRCSPQVLHAVHLNLKRLYAVLVKNKRQTHPAYLDTETFEMVDCCLQEAAYKNLFDTVAYLCSIQSILVNYHLTITAPLHENKHHSTNKLNRKKLAKKRKSDGVVDDVKRDGDEKLISFTALKAFAWITNNPRTKWERLGCRIMDILMATGMRVNEVLYLPRDCWVEGDIKSNVTGAMLEDYEGKTEKYFGLKYFAEKSAKNYIHWIEPNAVSTVKRAVNEILEITKPFHRQAVYLCKNEGKSLFHKDGPTVSLTDLSQSFLESSASFTELKKPSKKSMHTRLRDIFKMWCKSHHVQQVGTKEIVSPNGRTITDPLYSIESLEHAIRQFFTDPQNLHCYEFEVRNTRYKVKIEDLLLVAPPSSLGMARGTRVLHAVQPIREHDIAGFIGAIPNFKSIFDVHGFTEENGERIYLTSHMARHNINTFLALAGMAEHQQAIAMGRKDISQNKAYQHLSLSDSQAFEKRALEYKQEYTKKTGVELQQVLSPESTIFAHNLIAPASFSEKQALEQNYFAFDNNTEKQNFAESAINAGTLLGELKETYEGVKESSGPSKAKELISTHANNLHIVVNGACTRNIALHGCHKRLKCLSGGGCGNLHVTGRPGELENIKSNLDNMVANLEKLKEKVKQESAYTRAIEEQQNDITQMQKVLKLAKKVKSNLTPIAVFPEAKLHNVNYRPETIVDRFAAALPLPDLSKRD